MADFIVRLMEDKDIADCVAIFAVHELPEGAYGLGTYRKLCPTSCYVAEDTTTNKVVSMCMANTFDPRVTFIGFYGVAPSHQGKGVGWKVWQATMASIDTTRNLGLCSAPAQIEMYKRKGGFAIQDSVQMIHFDGTSSSIEGVRLTDQEASRCRVVALSPELTPQVIAYDESVTGLNRKALLDLGFKEPDTLTLVAVNGADQVIGYGCMRITNYKKPMIAPLYADDAVVAKNLVFNLMDQYHLPVDQGFTWFSLDTHEEATRLAESTGIVNEFVAPRLYTKQIINCPAINKVYAIYSPDFGPY